MRIPAGVYRIEATVQEGRRGLLLGSDMTLSLDPGAILQAIPNASPASSILVASLVSNVTIQGGTLQGDRHGHLGGEGEWGMGLTVSNASHVTVRGVTAKDCWGDGFYVTNRNSDLAFIEVLAIGNRRQGMSIEGGDGILVRASTFRDTRGTAPEFGIDIEPNRGQRVTGLEILDCRIDNNHGGGIGGGPAVAQRDSAIFSQSRIAGNRVTGNRGFGIGLSACSGNRIENNQVSATTGHGILLRSGALDMTITGNTVTGSSQDGIHLEDCPGTRVTGNSVTGNGGYGIRVRSGGVAMAGNASAGNGQPARPYFTEPGPGTAFALSALITVRSITGCSTRSHRAP